MSQDRAGGTPEAHHHQERMRLPFETGALQHNPGASGAIRLKSTTEGEGRRIMFARRISI